MSLISSRAVAGGIGSLPEPNSGGNDGRRVSGRDSLGSSARAAGALAASRAADPGDSASAAAEERRLRNHNGSLASLFAWGGFGASRGADGTGFDGSPASNSLKSSSGADGLDTPFNKPAASLPAKSALLATGDAGFRSGCAVSTTGTGASAAGGSGVGAGGSSARLLRIDERISSRLLVAVGSGLLIPHLYSHATPYVPGPPDLVRCHLRSRNPSPRHSIADTGALHQQARCRPSTTLGIGAAAGPARPAPRQKTGKPRLAAYLVGRGSGGGAASMTSRRPSPWVMEMSNHLRRTSW